MKQFLVEESERIQILQKHKSLLKEQTVSDYDKLEAGHRAGCFGTYPVPNGKPGRLSSGQYIFSKPSKSKPGEFVRFLPNNTYYFYNPTTKQSTQAFKNQIPCPAMENFGKPTEDQVNNDYLIKLAKNAGFFELAELRAKGEDTTEIDNPAVWEKKGPYGNVVLYKRRGTASGGMNQTDAQRKEWIAKLDRLGYDVNPNDVDKEKMTPVRLYSRNIPGLPPLLFPADQIVYIKQGQTSGSRLSQTLKDEDVDRKTCKDRIQDFYDYFMRVRNGRAITNLTTLEIARDEAQFCKNKYEGKWGIGGGKFDEMIQLLSGRKTGGPTSSGSDSIFRLQ